MYEIPFKFSHIKTRVYILVRSLKRKEKQNLKNKILKL